MPLLVYPWAVAHAVHALALADEYVFVAQTDVPVHANVLVDAPLAVTWHPVVYVPATADEHDVWPVVSVYVPAAHAIWLVAPVPLT